MNKQLFLLALLPLLLFADETWRMNYIENGRFENGLLTGVPRDAGASLSRPLSSVPEGSVGFRLQASGLEAKDLALSLRGKTNLHIRALAAEAETFLFHFEKLPEELSQMRVYFNSAKRFNGQEVSINFSNMEFFQEETLSSLPLVERKRIFSKTRIFPRIQSKYDLMKNYLGGYSLGSGTFTDRPLFFDRSLADEPLPLYNKLNSVKGFQRQLASALEFTDGLGIFLSVRSERFMLPIKAAEAGGINNAVFIECTPPRLKDFDKVSKDIDFVLASPAVFKEQGRLVVGSYHGEVFNPEQWREILLPYREKYGDQVLFMCELRGFVYGINSEYRRNGGKFTVARIEELKAYMRSYLEVVDGVNFSASNHLIGKMPGFPENVFNHTVYERFIIPLFASVLSEPAYTGKKLLGLSAHKGYNQVRSTGSNIDEQGTFGLRRSLAIALLANPDYIVMPEWNETNENTHVEPLVSNARSNQRVINAMQGIATTAVEKKYPDLILSFRQENDLAAPIPIELLGLPDSEASPSRVILRLLSPTGEILKTFPAAEFSHRKIEDVFYLPPAKDFAEYRFLIPELLIEWAGKKITIREGLPHIRLLTAPNQQLCYVKIPLRDLPNPEKIKAEIKFERGRVFAVGHAETEEEIVTLELLADDIPLAALDPKNEYLPPEAEVLLLWRRQTPAAEGFAQDTVKITALQGKIRLRQPHIYGLAGMAVPSLENNVLQGPIGGGASVREFFLFATEDAVLEIEERGEKATVAVSDVLHNQRFRKTASCGVSWQLMTLCELPELPFPLDLKKLDFQLQAACSDHKDAVYSLRVVTRAGRVFRSLPQMPPSGHKEPLAFPVWNLLSAEAEQLRVPAEFARDVVYDFDPRHGDILPALDGRREHDAMLGGFDYRTHSAPGWDALYAPLWRKDDKAWVLDFKPGCGIVLGPPIFSRSAFSIQLEVKFSDISQQTVLDVLGSKLPVKIKDGNLFGSLVTRSGKFSWESQEKLEAGRYYDLKLTYDLRHLRVYLDGRQIAAAEAEGSFADGWVLCIGGVPVKTPRPVANVLIQSKAATDIPNEGFAFSGSLRALRIANYPR